MKHKMNKYYSEKSKDLYYYMTYDRLHETQYNVHNVDYSFEVSLTFEDFKNADKIYLEFLRKQKIENILNF